MTTKNNTDLRLALRGYYNDLAEYLQKPKSAADIEDFDNQLQEFELVAMKPIEAIIDAACTEARIDELEYLKSKKFWLPENQYTHEMEGVNLDYINDRLAELQSGKDEVTHE
jgi:hypothetical protein